MAMFFNLLQARRGIPGAEVGQKSEIRPIDIICLVSTVLHL